MLRLWWRAVMPAPACASWCPGRCRQTPSPVHRSRSVANGDMRRVSASTPSASVSTLRALTRLRRAGVPACVSAGQRPACRVVHGLGQLSLYTRTRRVCIDPSPPFTARQVGLICEQLDAGAAHPHLGALGLVPKAVELLGERLLRQSLGTVCDRPPLPGGEQLPGQGCRDR